ncbi:hypothetical protein K3495_g6577 [Podosphaera aphanis]|nr:hypothetical protein K3495_g6577 [Podosphaera aphanis]
MLRMGLGRRKINQSIKRAAWGNDSGHCFGTCSAENRTSATDSVDFDTGIFEYLPDLPLNVSIKKFETGDDDYLKGLHETGSLRTTGCRDKRKRELESAAKDYGHRNLAGWCRSAVTATSQPAHLAQVQSSDGPQSPMIYGYKISELSNAIEELEQQLLDPTALSTLSNFELLRYVAIQSYLRNLVDGNSKTDASDIADKISKNKGQLFKARMIHLWADLFVRGEALPINRRGRHPKRNSLIHDEDVRFACLEYLRIEWLELGTPRD